jgi:endonuclease III
VASRLLQVKGVGQWTVDMFLIFHLGRQDVLPVGDFGLRAGVRDRRHVRRVARRRALVARWRFRRREVELRVAVAVLCFIGLPRGKMRDRYGSRDRRIV